MVTHAAELRFKLSLAEMTDERNDLFHGALSIVKQRYHAPFERGKTGPFDRCVRRGGNEGRFAVGAADEIVVTNEDVGYLREVHEHMLVDLDVGLRVDVVGGAAVEDRQPVIDEVVYLAAAESGIGHVGPEERLEFVPFDAPCRVALETVGAVGLVE